MTSSFQFVLIFYGFVVCPYLTSILDFIPLLDIVFGNSFPKFFLKVSAATGRRQSHLSFFFWYDPCLITGWKRFVDDTHYKATFVIHWKQFLVEVLILFSLFFLTCSNPMFTFLGLKSRRYRSPNFVFQKREKNFSLNFGRKAFRPVNVYLFEFSGQWTG